MTWKIFLLLPGSHHYTFHLHGTKRKFLYHCLDWCRFLTHHWTSLSSNCSHTSTVSLEPTLIQFSYACALVLDFDWFCTMLILFHPADFLQFYKKTLTHVSIQFFPICLVLYFPFSRHIVLSFQAKHFDIFWGLLLYFYFIWAVKCFHIRHSKYAF